jgi:hypothetical protein
MSKFFILVIIFNHLTPYQEAIQFDLFFSGHFFNSAGWRERVLEFQGACTTTKYEKSLHHEFMIAWERL